MTPDWIAADWGTSNLRIWAMQGGSARAARASDDGMGRLTPDGFEPALRALAGDWLAEGTPVVICGMAGAKGGWHEAGYAPLPWTPGAAAPLRVPGTALNVHILPGLSQSDPPDVMRGEETQIAGFLATRAVTDATLILPGTHAKWVRVEAGRVTGFRTAMTGELFALLSRQSILRLTLDGHRPGIDDDFRAGVAEGAASGLARLFQLRAAAVLGQGAQNPASRLSGLLIGAEIADSRALLSAPAFVIGSPALAAATAAALAHLGHPAEALDAEPLTLAGLTLTKRSLP